MSDNNNTPQESGAVQGAAEQQNSLENQNQPQQPSVEIDDTQFLEAYRKRFGVEANSIEDIKPKAAELTEDEVQKQQSAKEKELLDEFINNGGKVEDYTYLKQIVNADIKELSLADAKIELKNEGFDESEIEEILKERYYLMSEEDKALLSDEDKALLKKNEFFSKKLEGRGKQKIEQAKKFFSDLENSVSQKKLIAKVDAELSSKVDEVFQTMEKTIEIELGESNNQVLNPIKFDIDEADLAELKETLKDKTKREAFLYKEDGSENVEALIDALKWKYIAKSLVKKANLQGRTEEVEKFRQVFPDNHFAVAPANANRNVKGGGVGKVIEGSEKVKVGNGQRGR